MSTIIPEPAKVVKIDLSAGALHTVLVDGKPHVVLKSAVEDLGLDYSTQLAKLRGRSWATVGQSPMVAEDGKVREMAVVPVRTFLMLLATVNENRVKAVARPVLIAFQNETADAIEAYWTGATAKKEPRAITAAAGPLPYKEQAEILAILAPVLPAPYATATGKIILARSMGERPELDPSETPLYAATFLAEKGLSKKAVSKFESPFGLRVSNRYLKENGRRPEKIPGPAGSRIATVAAYTENDRPLLERVFAEIADMVDAFEVDLAGGQLAMAGGVK